MGEKIIKELSDENLQEVNAGSNLSMHFFDTPEQVRFIFWVNDIVYVKETFISKTVKCVVVGRDTFHDPQYNCYTDIYHVKTVDYNEDSFYYLNTWVSRDDIVNQAD